MDSIRRRRSSGNTVKNLRTNSSNSSSQATNLSPVHPVVHRPHAPKSRRSRSQPRLSKIRSQPYPSRSFRNNGGDPSSVWQSTHHIQTRMFRSTLSDDAQSSDSDSDSIFSATAAPLTVKERQAAINTKHPFGFRLWKPALYKKQRGIDKAAEQELFSGLNQADPSPSVPVSPVQANATSTIATSLLPSVGPSTVSNGISSSLLSHYYQKKESLRSRLFPMHATTHDPASQSILPTSISMIDSHDTTATRPEPHTTQHVKPQCWPTFTKLFIPSNIIWSLVFGIPLSAITLIAALIVLCLSFGAAYPTFIALARIAYYWIWPFNRHFVQVSRLESRPIKIYNKVLTRIILSLVIGQTYIIVAAASWMSVVFVPMAKAVHRVGLAIWNDPLVLVVDGVLSVDSNLHQAQVDLHHLPSPNLIVPNPRHTGSESEPLLTQSPLDNEPQHPTVTSVQGRIILCIARAGGLRYFKYTWHGTNVLFVNLIPFILWVLAEGYGMSLTSSTEPLRLFTLCLMATVPLSYFIGMAVASISAQSTPAIGAVLNATFGSIIEITLYSLALYNGKHDLVEGAVTGTLLGVLLLLPGISMAAGGLRFKQLFFNSKSAGVSTTMLIMALIGGFTPTLFNQIFGRIYVIGLIFSLKTHRKHIYHAHEHSHHTSNSQPNPCTPVPSLHPSNTPTSSIPPPSLTISVNNTPTKLLTSLSISNALDISNRSRSTRHIASPNQIIPNPPDAVSNAGGHEAPEWSRTTSLIVLISCTISFALIAELLVGTLEGVLELYPYIPEKFLGVTLVALVPSMTEFVNAAAFALQGNISLSLEIGSAYAVQVALLQIPSLVWYGVVSEYLGFPTKPSRVLGLVFPIWDTVCVFLAVFLLSYVYMEGQSNYFKGAILASSYFVLMAGFYFASILPVYQPESATVLLH